MIKYLFIIFFLLINFSNLNASDVRINSIITLENNIPKECGINFKILEKNKTSDTKISIKKNKDKKTTTFFSSKSDNFRIVDANIISPNVDLKKLLIKENQDKKKFEIENSTDLDKTNMFFQEILISGGKILINEKTHEVVGPIDSKVRLEYLFCTGEMFLPNYEKNR
ncbi:MAG: hypothetical protein CMM92_00955 [Rickettsiales bacterium]|nr:hypothetical protein [Rickettsiales bacterium]RPG15881.1 MAG: hypothetical protein CBD55_000960 [Pelagibacteraceae bacterium TMED195]|tara:strand:+ start:45 stop:548 length:504 start_codon:yes stop_codon:yes gene_type:complete